MNLKLFGYLNSFLFLASMLGTATLTACDAESEDMLEDPLFADEIDLESDQTDELPIEAPDTAEDPAVLPLPVMNSLVLWLRADAGVNVNQNGVYRWDDQSPASNDGTQATATALPEIVYQALNTYPVLRFDGDDFFVLDSKLQLDDLTIFVVAKSTKVGEGYHMILGAGGDTANTQMRFNNSTSVLFAGLGNGMPIITSQTGNTKVFHMLTVNYNGASWKVRRNGGLKSTTQFQNNGTWDLRAVGAWFSKYHLVGDIAEILVYDRNLSELEIGSVQNYLTGKYAL